MVLGFSKNKIKLELFWFWGICKLKWNWVQFFNNKHQFLLWKSRLILIRFLLTWTRISGYPVINFWLPVFFFSKTCVLVPVPHINRTGENPVLGYGVDSLKCWEEVKPTILIKWNKRTTQHWFWVQFSSLEIWFWFLKNQTQFWFTSC